MPDYDTNIGIAVSLKEGVYRYAYPAFKVFIFGQDVTEDVVEVRINQSGGSAERTPGGCSFTLVNQNDNYLITFRDMLKINESKEAFKEYAKEKIKVFEDDYSAKIIDRVAQFQDTQGQFIELSDTAGFAYQNEKAEFIEDIKAINEANKLLEEKISNMFLYDWASNIPGAIKSQVLQEKLSCTFIHSQVSKDTNMLEYSYGEIGDYPIQQGDCIFHPNDPIRIAFRDPYDPRIWYWMFAGFMDSFTENTSENLESYITITATDVTKMLRYSLVQMSTGVLDPNVDQIVLGFEQAAETGFIPYNQIFANFSIYEVLETLFFGGNSTDKILYESTVNQILSMSDLDKQVFLQAHCGMTDVDVEVMMSSNPIDANVKISDYLFTTKSSMLQSMNFPPITSPAPFFKAKDSKGGVVKFSRKDSLQGVYMYYMGDPDKMDEAYGEQVPSLSRWNKELHHMVVTDDLTRMLTSGETGVSNPSALTVEQIVEEIGRNKVKYPVGSGRVYYLTPHRLNGDLGRNMIDKSMGGSISMHSEFRDRLSFVYDLAENIDARFYATPKGDIVFETVHFYDFDPEQFVDTSPVSDTDISQKMEELNQRYEDLLGEAYAGNYQGYANDLTQMRIELNAAEQDFDWIDFSKAPKFDWAREFTIEEHEQYSYSVTATDEGVLTAYRAVPSTVAGYSSLHNPNLKDYKWAFQKEHIRMLGLRVGTGATWGWISSDEMAEYYSGLMLKKMNAEARNMSINTIPKFGLMVNRPVFWRKKNYSANIVSMAHSISWGSSCDTSIVTNQIRGWTGEVVNGRPKRQHFGGDQPVDDAKILWQNQVGKKGGK